MWRMSDMDDILSQEPGRPHYTESHCQNHYRGPAGWLAWFAWDITSWSLENKIVCRKRISNPILQEKSKHYTGLRWGTEKDGGSKLCKNKFLMVNKLVCAEGWLQIPFWVSEKPLSLFFFLPCSIDSLAGLRPVSFRNPTTQLRDFIQPKDNQ